MKQSYRRNWSSGGSTKELRFGGGGFGITYMQRCPWRHMGMQVEERQSKSTSQKVQKTYFETTLFIHVEQRRNGFDQSMFMC